MADSLVGFMTDDHRTCDQRLAEVEERVRADDWAAAAPAWAAFDAAMRRHFAREEEVLFPAFEQATGSSQGPTAVMRMEHDQMRALLQQLDAALVAEDRKRFLGLSDTLMVLAQQHNMKEEQILYPMSEQVLPDPAGLLGRIAAVEPPRG